MKITRNAQINKLFELGIYEIEQRNFKLNDKKYLYHEKDVAANGEMENFANYTIDRFENEFGCSLWFNFG